MKRFLALGALLGALAFWAGSAHTQPADVGRHTWKDLGTVLNAVACNASAATRTWTASAGAGAGFGLGVFQLDFNYTAGGDPVTWTCYGSLNGGTTWAELQSCSVSSGTCTSTDAVWSKATGGANDDWILRVDFLGVSDVKCTFACTGGGASDTVSVFGKLSDL